MHTDSKKEMKHRCSLEQKAYLICSLKVQFNDKKKSDVYKIVLQICLICKQHGKLESENWSSVSLLLGKEQSVQPRVRAKVCRGWSEPSYNPYSANLQA